MAPGFGEDDQIACQRRRHPDDLSDGRARTIHRRCPTVGGHARVRRQRRHRQGAEGSRRCRPPRHLQPPVSALLAMRRAVGLPRDQQLVRAGVVVQGPDGRAQPANPVGPGARQGGQLRQVARQRTRLEHQPQPLLGVADPGVAQRRSRTTRASMSTDRSPTSSAISASRSTTCIGRRSTTSCVRIPMIRPAGR